MAAPDIGTTNRYVPASKRKFCWTPAIANTSAPTRAEINAGTNLSPQVANAAGWSGASEFKDAPDFGTRNVAQVPGLVKFAQSSLTMYQSSNSVDVRTILTRDLAGYMIVFLEGDVAGQKMDVFTVTVASVAPQHGAPDDLAVFEIGFGMFALVQNVTVPA